ncbi:MAG: hypothetical protein Q8P18_32625 [Pseudomonadota bacterium]|nr:hypothetical protein [Pseudomonadota bacterium]
MVFALGTACAPAPRRPRSSAPAADALACTGFDFAPADGVARCSASPVVDGVAVEKAWTRGAVEHTLLLEDAGTWRRWPLGRKSCGGEVPAGCSHDEMFRRTLDIAREGDRVALHAKGVYEVDPNATYANTVAWSVILVDGAAPYAWSVHPEPASAEALLGTMPRSLAEAYAATLTRGTPVEHATAAYDAGVPGPREVLTPLLVPPATCDEGSRVPPLGDYLENRLDDPWTLDVLGASHAPCLQQPDGTDTLRLPAACREALAACGLEVEAEIPISVWEGNRQSPAMLVPSAEPAPYLAPDFRLSSPIWVAGPIFAATRETITMIHSRTGVVWLGPEEVHVHQIRAPVSVAPASPAGSTWRYPSGTRWCFIAPDVCPQP